MNRNLVIERANPGHLRNRCQDRIEHETILSGEMPVEGKWRDCKARYRHMSVRDASLTPSE